MAAARPKLEPPPGIPAPALPLCPAPAVHHPLRALIVGVAIGAVLAAGNVYAGLKTGYIDGGSITAALVGSLLLGLWARRPASRLDLNLTQTVASSAAVMSFAAGVGAPIPALALSGRTVGAGTILAWGLGLALVGIALAWFLRRRLIVDEALPFPSGQATAEVIEVLAGPAPSGAGRAELRALGLAAVVAAAFTFLRDGGPGLIPAGLTPGFAIFGFAAAALTLGVSSSPLLVATGILVGQRTALSMAIGALCAWGLLAPFALRAGAATEASYGGLVPVLLFPGLAFMVGGALTALALAWRSLRRSAGDLLAVARGGMDGVSVEESRDGRRLALAAAVAVVPVGIAAVGGFGLSPLIVVGLVPVALALAAAAARAAGETDQAPIGQVGSLAQLGLGGQGIAGSLGAGALVAGVATQTAQTLWAFKAGHRLGAAPRTQVLAQIAGAVIGVAVVVPIYALVKAAYPLGSETMPAPAALAWKATSEAAHGALALGHPLVWKVTLGAALLAAVLTILERRIRWLPSPTAIGAAFVLPAAMSVAILLGALGFALVAARAPRWAERHGPALAAGGIAGESLLGLILAAIAVAGGR
jgi:putative OPT family oligopeptide transporter